MKIKKMEVEEKILPAVDNSEESSATKGKILTLLFPAESQSAEGKEVKKDKNKPPTKIVIRRLPPKLTREAFIEEFSPLPAHDYFHFVRGDLNLGLHAFSRAYINFLNQEDIFSFKEKFDDYDIQDDKGKIYHAVVEFAPSQKVPRRNAIKKKVSKAGTLESDPKYIEFLQKLEESKNFINNPSEYFHETESSALKAKIVTTPLLEYLKKKKQKKIDLRNEIRQRKREAEKEKRKKEEEKRKAEREKRKEDKKNLEKIKLSEEKGKKIELKDKKHDERGWFKDEKKDLKNSEALENEPLIKESLDSVIPNDPAILEVVVRHSSTDKELKSVSKNVPVTTEDTRSLKSYESDTNVGKPEKKYSDFRSRLIEEKQRKTFYKRDIDDFKTLKTNYGSRKGVPDEKGDNYSIGNCSEAKDSIRKVPLDSDTKRHDYKVEVKETKSKFRYSEQRNRDREFRQKTSDCKSLKENLKTGVESKEKIKDSEEKPIIKVSNLSEEELKKSSSEQKGVDELKCPSTTTDQISLPSRRKSLEIEREVVDTERKRSKSFHDISGTDLFKFKTDEKIKRCNSSGKTKDENMPETPSNQTDENSKEGIESGKVGEESKKERKTERRIRNKDRPSLEIYRPGMGKFSKQRLGEKKEDGNGISTVSSSSSNKSNPFIKSGKKTATKSDLPDSKTKSEELKNNGEIGKTANEVRVATVWKSTDKEN